MNEDSYKITFETWNKIAGLYQDKFMDLDLYNDTYDRFCEEILNVDAKVLEIGCGPGNITRYILSKRPDLILEGIDVAPDMILLAQKNNPGAVFHEMDARKIDMLGGKYDAVVCGFCMPYLSKSGFEAGSSGDKSFVYYHTEDFFLEQLKQNEFDLICLDRKEYPKTHLEISTHLIFIARKK